MPPFPSADAFWEHALAPLMQGGGQQFAPDGSIEIHMPPTGDGGGDSIDSYNEFGGVGIQAIDGGGVSITIPGEPEDAAESIYEDPHYRNLAPDLTDGELALIADDCVQGFEQDERDRQQYMANRAKGVELLALQLEQARTDAGSGGTMEGMSTIRTPFLLEAVLRFQATARGELLPANGPVKIDNKGKETLSVDSAAKKLVRDFNKYLTTTAKEYYPDTDKLLFSVGFGGCGFKKIFHCPIRRRPASDSVDAKDLVVPNTATDLHTAERVTHIISMSPSTMKRMQYLGVYRDVTLIQPTIYTNVLKEKIAKVTGISPNTIRPQDQDHTILEMMVNLDLPGFWDVDEEGYATGLKLPYRVAIDRDSKQILEIRRNWKPDDKNKEKRRVYVKYSFVPGFGFYDLGLLHILGNASMAVTAAWRILLDNGMFASFPGFLFSKQAVGRQLTNEFRIAPGGALGLDVGNMPIGQAVMGLPYRALGAEFPQFIEMIQSTMQRVGSTAETSVGEGRQDAPVGTTLALIEQAKVMMDAVHKRLHAAQAEEFQALIELFREDPGAFWRFAKDPEFPQDEQELMMALDDHDLVPVADPNVPSNMHRQAKVAALLQLVQNFPELFDIPAVLNLVLTELRFDNPQELLAKGPPPAPPPDPKIQVAQLNAQVNREKLMSQAQSDEATRKSQENLKMLELAKTEIVHPQSAGFASNPVVPPGIS